MDGFELRLDKKYFIILTLEILNFNKVESMPKENIN